ncbi:SMI1/KNR4 family protein [Streptomyces sp. NPDC047024]|uniref:SMI1/KNR4 family protein n=1 Tax=Streptomyces sp. NPDC047024 TaxID=3155476 RepID=UPI003403FDD7
MTPDLGRLTQVMPRPSAPAHAPDWNAAEATLNTTLPADYKELISTYGGGFVDGLLLLLEPGCANDVYDQLKISAECEEANEALWQYEDRPTEMEQEGNRLVCWATTDNGDCLYWLVRPGDSADSRPVLINDESGQEWERYDMTVTRFLTAVLDGEVRSRILWDKFPSDPHEFRPARGM